MTNYFKDIIRLFTSSAQEERTRDRFHTWLADPQYADEKDAALRECWEQTDGSTTKASDKVLQQIYRKAGLYQPARNRYRIVFLRYAAAVALLAASVYTTHVLTKEQYANVAMIEKYIGPGEMQSIELPDGTAVQLNSGSLLLYPEKFAGSTRTLFLIGEAHFKVKKNAAQPFIVRSGTLSVTALGTEFNVKTYADDEVTEATLLQGKVKVDCGTEGKNYVLNPGEQVSYNKDTGESLLAKVDVDDVTAWQRGELVFHSVTVRQMVAVLQRKFDIRFHYPPDRFNDDKYNFRFSSKASFHEVMKIMQSVIGDFGYRTDGNDCYIE